MVITVKRTPGFAMDDYENDYLEYPVKMPLPPDLFEEVRYFIHNLINFYWSWKNTIPTNLSSLYNFKSNYRTYVLCMWFYG